MHPLLTCPQTPGDEKVGGSEGQTGVFTSSSSDPKLEATGQGYGLALDQPLHSHQELPQNTTLYR